MVGPELVMGVPAATRLRIPSDAASATTALMRGTVVAMKEPKAMKRMTAAMATPIISPGPTSGLVRREAA
jgi:hypothetical protein